MLVDLVEVRTSDEITLGGAYFASTEHSAASPAPALLFFHGDGGHFHRRLYLEMGQRMAERGIAFLTANRRGHDFVSNGASGGPLAGYAHESVSESPRDYAAWLDLLRERGHQRIVIGGHSGGAVRAVFSQSSEKFANVVGVVAVSPGEYDHETLTELHGEEFSNLFHESHKILDEGYPDAYLRPRIPFGAMWTARTFVDCFNTDNRYSVVAHAADMGCPTLFVFGSEECAGPQELPLCGAAMRQLTDAAYPGVQVKVIDGANHGYADRDMQLFETIHSWMQDAVLS